MSYTVENLEKSMAKLTIECTAEEFDQAVEKAYQKQKNKINIPGFRKGKAPKKLIIKEYGAEIFYDDAANELINKTYPEVATECGLAIVSRPEIAVTEIKLGEKFVYTATVAVKPEVTLGEYKGLEVTKQDRSVSDEEVEAEVNKALEQNAKIVDVTDRAVEAGDMTKIDFEGFVDGVAFAGGKGTDYDLTIGSGAFIPGFEDQIIGKNIGEDFDVNVTFPENYQAAELAGKPAVFKCKVNSIKKKVIEEATDEFASEVSEFDTLAEYKADIRKNLEESKDKAAKETIKNEAVEIAAANATIELPAPMIETEKQNMAEEFAQRLQAQGLQLEQYFQFSGLTYDKFVAQMEPQAISRIRTRLTLEKIAEVEKLEASDEDLDKEFEEMAKAYQMEVQKVKDILGSQAEDIKKDLVVRKAADIIAESAKETKEMKSTVSPASAEEKTEEKPKKRTTRKKKTEETSESAE